MTISFKTLVGMLLLGWIFLNANIPVEEAGKTLNYSPAQPFVNELKEAALKVLQTKCNECHKKKSKRSYFTQWNMSDLAPKIYKQVFVKKRMPKGKEFRLTEKEYTTLKNWLDTEKLDF